MTVADLIKKLQAMPQNVNVVVNDIENEVSMNISSVSVYVIRGEVAINCVPKE